MHGKKIDPCEETAFAKKLSLAQEQAEAFDDDRRRGFLPGSSRIGSLVPLLRN